MGLFLFMFDKDRAKEYALIFLSSGVILAFYIFWGGFQCRYIVAAAIPLMVISAKVQAYALERISNVKVQQVKYILQIVLITLFIYATVKTLRVDMVMAIPNMACYF